MVYLGSWKMDDLLTFCANTYSPTTGAAQDADSAPTYRLYEDEVATPLLTGTMAKLDDAGTTGFYSEQVTLSAANGFEKGKCYTIYVQATVGGVTGTMHHSFQLEAEVDANVVSDAALATAANQTTILGRLPAALVSGKIDADVGAMQTAVVNTIRDAVTGDIIETEGSITLQQALSVILSVLAGVTENHGLTFNTPNGTTVRVAAVVDSEQNRTTITLTPSS